MVDCPSVWGVLLDEGADSDVEGAGVLSLVGAEAESSLGAAEGDVAPGSPWGALSLSSSWG